MCTQCRRTKSLRKDERSPSTYFTSRSDKQQNLGKYNEAQLGTDKFFRLAFD